MENSRYTPKLRELKERLGFDFVSLALVVEAGHPLLTWVCATGNKNSRYRRIVLEPGKGIAGGVYKSGLPMVLQNADKELNEAERVKHPITIAEELKSVLAFPLWNDKQVAGVLLLAFRKPDQITKELYSAVIAEISPEFCAFQVHADDYDHTIHVGSGEDIDPVPVYELMSYPVIRAQEEERRRISRELHDSVVQELIGVQMLLRATKYQPDREEILEMVAQADARINQIQTELRSISTSLRPVTLDDLGLPACFRSYFNWIKQSHKVEVHFLENVKTMRFTQEQETVFYRVCQEAVLNACKYSGCDKIEVSLIASEGYLTLEVTDSGCGFDPEAMDVKGSGLGLPGMADRAELIDGELTYQSTPGFGTSIWLTAPVTREDKL